MAADAEGISVGQIVGDRYRIRREIGRGGLGIVYEAWDDRVQRRVAVKVLRHVPAPAGWALQRFQNEKAALARVDHPAVVRLYDVGEVAPGTPFLVMELVEGETLRKAFGARLPTAVVAAVALQTGRAVSAAHAHGVLHRDLSPENVILQRRAGSEVVVRVIDFGIAAVRDGEGPAGPHGTLVVAGRPAYMAPEQRNGRAEPASDVYALGAIMYEALAGVPPYQVGSFDGLARAQQAPPQRPSAYNPSIPEEVEELLLRALDRDPARRPSARDFGEALDAALGGETVRAPELDPELEGADTVPRQDLPHATREILQQVNAALAKRSFDEAHRVLDAAMAAGPHGTALGVLWLYRGRTFYFAGDVKRAVECFHRALALVGRGSPQFGKVLEGLALIYDHRGHYLAARDLLAKALESYETQASNGPESERDAWIASTGQVHNLLGWFYFGYGRLDEAEEHFRLSLRLCEERGDRGTSAQLLNHLGQVELRRGNGARAEQLLDEAIGICESEAGEWPIIEGFVRKDRAAAHATKGEIDKGLDQVARAESLFEAHGFREGLGHAWIAHGTLARLGSDWERGTTLLTNAARTFRSIEEYHYESQALLELARLRSARGAGRVIDTLRHALESAERSGRDTFVAEVLAEIRRHSPEEATRIEFRRARGAGSTDTTSLLSGVREAATIMMVDLQNSTALARSQDPAVFALTMNHLVRALAEVLQRHRVYLSSHRGDGFMAISRGEDHAYRAVTAALDLNEVLNEFNVPRRLLELPVLQARVGISTGEVFLGNVGTYGKVDFTAMGAAVALAARLESTAVPGTPAISAWTRDAVGRRFSFSGDGPRNVELKGFDPQQVWDVVARA